MNRGRHRDGWEVQMKGRAVLVVVGVIAMFAFAQAALAAGVCPNTDACVQVTVGSGSGKANDLVTIPITFKQGPDNSQPGGIDEIAALALTLRLTNDDAAVPLLLASCTLNDEGLPGAVKPDASISNFKVVVENASCAGGRTHCLCPDQGSGITPDNFINLVVYGPNPLPTPGPSGIDIPTLPSGPPPFVTIDLRIGAGASGMIPLHVFNEVDDAQHPQFTALLSVGDKLAVDQTCVPVSGQPPCSAADSVSQVATTDGSVTAGGGCVGDCSGNSEVTVDELITMVNISLENLPVTNCPAGDANGDGSITINEIIAAVNNSLNSCPQAGAAARR